MSPAPDSTLDDPQQTIADLKRQLAEAVAERDENQAQKEAMAEVLGVINASPGDLAPVFDAMLEKAMRLCEADFGGLWSYDGGNFRSAAMSGVPTPFAEFCANNLVFGPGSGPARLVEGEPFNHVVDLTASEAYLTGEPNRKALVDLGGARTALAVPLRKDDALVGLIMIYRQEVRPFSDKQIALLQNFAAQAVIAMENARLITETREALEQQIATAEVLGVINSSPGDLAPVFEAIWEKAHTLCGAAFGSLFTYDGEFFHGAASHGLPEAIRPERRGAFRPGLNNPLWQMARGAPLAHIPDMRELVGLSEASEAPEQSHLLLRAAVEQGSVRTMLMVPLRKDGALLGVISAYRQEVKSFTDKQIALLQSFAAQAVIAMVNARLITETREALEQQTATSEVLGVINSSPGDIAPVFDAMLEKAMRLCEATHGQLATFDGDQFRTVAASGDPGWVEFVLNRGAVPLGAGTPMARVFAGESTVHIDDVVAEYGPSELTRTAIDLGRWRTMLGIALRKDDAVLGAFGIYRQEVRPFTDRQIALLQSFAEQAVIAMDNARLLDELRQRTDEVAELNRGLEARVAEQVDELGRVGRLKRFLAPQLAELIVSQGDEQILESHRREIVVVFCDLRGYTAFTETAEPEEVLDFLRQYHGALGPLVSQFEGTLDQFSGDGIMVFFNDPVPCPDPAERAVKMAVAMRAAAGTLIAAWRRRGRMLGFGAGIAQGYATLGQIGFADRSGYTAIGTVCNLAARLCAEAKDGQILVGQRVAVAVEETVPLEEVGELTLKGLTQPVVAYNVPLGAIQPALRVIEGGSPETV